MERLCRLTGLVWAGASPVLGYKFDLRYPCHLSSVIPPSPSFRPATHSGTDGGHTAHTPLYSTLHVLRVYHTALAEDDPDVA